MIVPRNQNDVDRCNLAVDTLQSIVEKLKLFPLPAVVTVLHKSPRKPQAVDIDTLSSQCTVLAMTILHVRAALVESRDPLQGSQAKVLTSVTGTIQSLRLATNTYLEHLIELSTVKMTPEEKYVKQFSKVVQKCSKLLDACSKKLKSVLDLLQTPSIKTTAVQVQHLMSSIDHNLPLADTALEELFEALQAFTIRSARRATERALEGSAIVSSSDLDAGPPSTAFATVKRVMSNRNAAIDAVMKSRERSSSEARPTRAEEQGFVSRTLTTRREPNWKDDAAQASSTTDREIQAIVAPATLKSLPDPPESFPTWPLCSPEAENESASTPLSSTSSKSRVCSAFDLDEVYDSYHDHDIDATLGLPGSNAVHALQRQPSHTARSKFNLKTNALLSPPPIPLKHPRAHVPACVIKAANRIQRSTSNICYPDKLQAQVIVLEAPGSAVLRTASMPMTEVRDQYY